MAYLLPNRKTGAANSPRWGLTPKNPSFRGAENVTSGGNQVVGANFTQRLAELQRTAPDVATPRKTESVGLTGLESGLQQLSQQRAAVSGRAPSRNEVAGLVEGLAAKAQGRLERREELDQRERFHSEELQSQFDLSNNQIAANAALQENDIRAGFANTQAQLDSQRTLQDAQIRSTEDMFRYGEEQEMGRFREQFDESQRQFNENMNTQQEQFWATYDQSSAQFRDQLNQNARQFSDAQSQEYDIFSQTLRNQQYETGMEISAAERQFQHQLGPAERVLGSGSAASSFTQVLDPGGTFAGGGLLGGTWLCTAMSEFVTVDAEAISTLREYIMEEHKGCFGWYISNGDLLTTAISDKEKNLRKFYEDQKDTWLNSVTAVVPISLEAAYQVYKAWVIKLVAEYTPELSEELGDIISEDVIHG